MKEKARQKYDFRISVASAGLHRELCIVYHAAELAYLEARGPAFCTSMSDNPGVTASGERRTIFSVRWLHWARAVLVFLEIWGRGRLRPNTQSSGGMVPEPSGGNLGRAQT